MCECGCGEKTSIARVNIKSRGQVKGQPVRFIHGHAGRNHTLEARAKMSEASKKQTREKNPRWRGGRQIVDGRVHLLVGKDHPMADSLGYCLEHRLVMAAVIGRFLAPTEVVHHINCDHNDNRPENLVIVTPSQHGRIHGWIRCRGMDPEDALREVIS
jgi:hypothetical protein